MSDIAAIRARLAAATSEPWGLRHNDRNVYGPGREVPVAYDMADRDQQLIVNAPSDIRNLLATVDKRVHLPLMFEFTTFQQWLDKARAWFPSYGVAGGQHVCLDAKGRICNIGKHFMQARDEDAFPVRVYSTCRGHQEVAAFVAATKEGQQ